VGKLKLALLGVGDVAQRDYLPEFHRIADRAELVGACGRTEERVNEVADLYGIPARYTDYRRMLAETDAAAVVNLLPIQLHAETTLACLEAGKHVYVEKTVAGTAAEAARLRDEARQQGLTLVCAPSVLLYPQVRFARRLLTEDAIGPVHSARGHGHGGVPPWGGYPSDPSPFFAAGGGPAVDMGVYPLHALTGLLGPARSVSAMAARAQRSFVIGDGPLAGREIPVAVPDNWHLVLDLGGELLASIQANNVVQGSRAPQLELFGLRGTIALNLLDVSAPVEVLRPSGAWESIPVPHDRATGPDHILGVEHLVDCVATGMTPVLGIDHALHVVEIIEAAARSAETGSTQDLASTFERRDDAATQDARSEAV
jgi:predicted dehydrogenase